MSILNVNQIQPVGGGNTITVSASDISASGATITATSFVGSVTGTTSNASGATGDFSIADKIVHTGDTNTAIRFPAADTFTVETAGSERLRITSDGDLVMNGASPNHDASSGSLFIKSPSGNPNRGIKWSETSDTHYVKLEPSVIDGLTINGYSGVAFATGSRTNSTWVERVRIDSGGRIITGNYSTALDTTAGSIIINGDTNGGRIAQRGSGSSANTTLGEMFGFWDTNKVAGFQFTGGSDTSNKDDGQIKFYTSSSGPNVTERLRISSNGTIILGTPTSTVLKAEVCNSVSGHQFISQCDNNNNGFEIYQQHASNTTRNNFAVYANTGNSNAKDLQFSVRGDGCVTKPNNPAFLAGRTGGNQTFTLGTFPFNVARINVGNCWNTSTYKFTAPVAGIYYFFASVYYNDGAGQHRIHFRKTPNGGSAFQVCTVSHQAASSDDSKSMSVMESMAVGDTMELYSDQNAAVQCYYNINNTTYGAHTYMMGYLIG